VFLDGAEIERFSVPVIVAAPDQVHAIGGWETQTDRGFDGIIDEVAFYNAALTPARILTHYRTGLRYEIGSSGSGAESYVFNDTGSGTATASGTGTEVYSAPIVYTDSRTATVTATGTGFQTYTPYDAVLDEDNPVSHWKLGDPSTAIDRRQTQNLPAIGGPINTAIGVLANNASDLGNAFTGTQRFGLNSATNRGVPYNTANWAIETWIKPAAIGSQQFAVRRAGLAAQAIYVTAGGTLRFDFRGDAGSQILDLISPVIVGTTYHVVATWDGANVIVYVNGVEKNRRAVTTIGSSSDDAPIIGSDTTGSNPFTGTVDEVAWYPAALSAARVLAHYQAGVATAYDAVVDADTPVSHWKMGWSTTKAVDRARRKLNLDAQNPPIAISDKGVVYQGDNDRANTFVTGSSQRLSRSSFSGSDGTLYDTANLSVEAWIKPTATRLGFGDSPGIINRQFSEVVLQLFSAKPRFSFNDTAVVSKIASSPISLVANAAYHLVGTYDGANLILYVNGAEMARLASATGIRSDPTNYPQIGYAGGDYWDGDIDEVAWYDTALSPARVQAHFLAGIPGYSTVSGTGTDAAVYTDSGSGTATAIGTGSESYSVSDSGLGTATVSGTSVELCVASDSGYVTVVVSGSSVESNYISQILRPDADIAVAGWVTAPLYSKLSDDSDATVVTGVLV